jgi:hypothetical protein
MSPDPPVSKDEPGGGCLTTLSRVAAGGILGMIAYAVWESLRPPAPRNDPIDDWARAVVRLWFYYPRAFLCGSILGFIFDIIIESIFDKDFDIPKATETKTSVPHPTDGVGDRELDH